jgi:hypothetical protein
MKKVMTWIILALLAAGSASAETIKVDDDATGGNSYGNTAGFAIDFDATAPAAASSVTTGWDPPLVAGKSYALNSISIQYGGSVTIGSGVVYLGVYSGGVNGEGFVGVSTNAIDFNTATADNWYTWEFEGINVTVDSTVGSGTGLLYFRYQPSQNSGDIGGTEISTRRLNYDAAMTQGLASIIAYGTLQGARAPEYIADIGSKDTPFMPHDPVVLPENEDGSSGTLQANNADIEVTFSFNAAMNSEETAVNPDVLGHYIYLTKGTSDPNLYLLDYVAHSDLNNPSVSYGPVVLINGQGKTFKWKVEEAVDKGGIPGPAGDPNNIMGNDWTFKALGANPQISSDPVHTLTDASGNATLAITTTTVASNFQWFKVVGAQDTAENLETDDIKLTDSGIYSGTTTKTLTLTGAASNGSDDAQFYAIAYNGDPATPGIPSVTSATAWVWYPRLVNHYTFESVTDGVTPDVAGGYDMAVLSNDTGNDVPALAAGMPELGEATSSLKFDNPRGTDPNIADAQYAQISEGWAGGYKDITISMWVYSSGGSNWNRILDFGNDTDNYMFVCINPGSVNRQVRFAVKVNGTEQSVSSATEALPDNAWTYVTATLKDNTARIYVNGELVGTNTSFTNDPVSYGPSVQNWLARSQWGTGDGYFNGMLDDLKIYNYARTTEQIAKDYLALKGEWICNRELAANPYDFDGNCRVDIEDFAAFATGWMESNRIYLED